MSVYSSVFLVLFSVYFSCLTRMSCEPSDGVGKLPYCGNSESHEKAKRLVFVSTLDGKLSALDIDGGGSKSWSLLTGPGPMLSSSIDKLKLTNNVRMIPSLSGGLYQFNGEDIVPIPITADNLLKSSFIYSDDLVISGGKESRTYGVEMETGRVLYECSMSKCDNLTGFEAAMGDVVLIQRQTQTVRAVESRSGVERWNFSVGQHDLKVAPNPSANCHHKHDTSSSDILLKVIVPDGLVCAISKSKPGSVIWQHKFEYPIVSAWEVVGENVEWVDLFGGANNPRISEEVPDSPLLYIGLHNNQLYIQESVTLQKKILESSLGYQPHLIGGESRALISIPWKPVSASGNKLGITGPNEPILQITDETNKMSANLPSEFYGAYVNGKGIFLYSSETLKKKETALCAPGDDSNNTILTDEETQNDNIDTQAIISVWHWWREIIFLSIGCAIAINVIIQRRFIPDILRINSEVIVVTKTVTVNSERPEHLKGPKSAGDSYTSRYLTDFEPVHRLGKGGFGVVFQAKNKIDDCHYAIKRITLPNKEKAKKRVMREVKALAKLDHQNIVRYFNAWVECPPAEWQEQQDRMWAHTFGDLRSEEAITVDLSGHVTPTSEPNISINMKQRRQNNFLKSLWNKASSLYSGEPSLEESLRKPQLTSHSEKSDSFIVFDYSNQDLGQEQLNQSDSIVFYNSSGSKSEEECNDTSKNNNHSLLKKMRPDSLNLTSDDSICSMSPTRIYLYIQMQLCQRDSLREWLTANTVNRDPKQILSIFSQIVQAVEYVHFQGLIHRDLKPSNIFFSPDGQIKVGDFGLVTGMMEGCDEFASPPHSSRSIVGERHTARVGTQLYMSPEQLLGRQYNYKVDIYSLGLILFELLVPFSTQMERHQILTSVRKGIYPEYFKTNHPDEYVLLEMMLCELPEKRLTTIGIRCRPPLVDSQLMSGEGGSLNVDVNEWHFELPSMTRRRNSSTSKSTSNDS